MDYCLTIVLVVLWIRKLKSCIQVFAWQSGNMVGEDWRGLMLQNYVS